MSRDYCAGRVQIVVGDITRQSVDAIVNAANATLLGGGGVDGAIHRRGGPAILEACREIRCSQFPNGLPIGEAVVTIGGLLPARFVIHTVGPVWGRDDPADELLASCYRRSLELAAEHAAREIAFPAISTGAYGFPKDRAAQVASQAVAQMLASNDSIERVRLVFFAQPDAEIFERHHCFE
jgi:O-acetyl-ADP-ribose deacetylase (regulator of RNase III)